MLSSKMSQPVKTRSLSCASGTKSLIFGERPSVRLPRRMVPICVSDPMGKAMPLRTASTPATNVVATAPIPGIMMPRLPLAGAIFPSAGRGEEEVLTLTVAVDFVFALECFLAIEWEPSYWFVLAGWIRNEFGTLHLLVTVLVLQIRGASTQLL